MKKRVTFIVALVLLLTTVFILPLTSTVKEQENDKTIYKSSLVINDTVNAKSETELVSKDKNSSEPYESTDIVTVTAELSLASLSENYLSSELTEGLSEYLSGKQAGLLRMSIKNQQSVFISSLEEITGEPSGAVRTSCVVMNSVTFRCKYGKLSEIKKLDGVKRAYVNIELEPFEDSESDTSVTADSTDDADDTENGDSEPSGAGTVISILDTGFDINHDIFTLSPENGKYSQDDFMYILAQLQTCIDGDFTPTELYKSQKLLYAYDYAENDNDVSSDYNKHGTMVAGIVGGDTENIAYSANAYSSQLLFMKCSGDDSEKTDSSVILSAIEDSLILGADIINISYGSENMLESGFKESFGEMLERVYKCGTAVVMPAGNLGKADSESSIDNGTASPIASLGGVISVSSAEGANNYSRFFLYNDERIEYVFPKNSEGKTDYSFEELKDGDYDYILYSEEVWGKDLEGKVVLASAEDESELIDAIGLSEDNNAAAMVIFSEDGLEGEELTELPYIMVKSTSIENFGESGAIRIEADYILTSDNEYYGKISENASYGSNGSMSVNPLLAEISPGYSSVPNNGYGTASGSSFSSALVSGKLAILKEYINSDERFKSYTAEQKNELSYKLITSTAEIITDRSDSSNETVRTQGAGLVSLDNALSANAYISSGFSVIGSSETGEYELELEITNISDKEITLTPSLALACEVYDLESGNISRQNIIESNYTAVFFVDDKESDTLSVASGKTLSVKLKIKLNSAFILSQRAYFSDGFYLDGYVYFSQEDGVTLSTALSGFVGDYAEESSFGEFVYDDEQTLDGQSGYLYLSSDDSDTSLLLGYNKFTEMFSSENISFNSSTLKAALNDSSLSEPTLYLRSLVKRNLTDFKCTVKDESGTVIYESESFDREGALSTETASSLNIGLSKLSDGKYTLTISGKLEESAGKLTEQERSFSFTVDSKKPGKTSYRTYFSEDKTYLEVSAYDNTAIQGFEFYAAVYNEKTGKYEYSSSVFNLMKDKSIAFDESSVIYVGQKTDSSGSTTFTYDITGLKAALKKLAEKYNDEEKSLEISQNKVAFAAVDYAYNISEIKLCDTVVYDSLTLKFVDKDGNPVSGVEAEINSKSFTSDENGKIIYASLPAGAYTVKLTSIPNKLCAEKSSFTASTDEVSEENANTIKLMPEGTYAESSEETSVSRTSGENRDEQKPSKELNPIEQPDDTRDSIYAFILVGGLLIVCIASFLVSKKTFKR